MPTLKAETLALLEDIEKRIDTAQEDLYLKQCEDFAHKKFTGTLFDPTREIKSATNYNYKNININDALLDYEIMLVSELEKVSKALEDGKNFLNVRANYGTGIMTSLFGAEIFTMPRNTNTLPTTLSISDEDKLAEIISNGIPNLNTGFSRNVFEMGEFFLDTFKNYPKTQKYVSVYHPDAQGPLDICELLWGSDMFYALYDDPDFVHSLLKLITETYIKFMEKWYTLYPQTKDWTNHWTNCVYQGKLMIRNDSAMNLSPEMYDEFAKPYDAQLLKHFGGGAIHFCGRGDHYIKTMSEIPNLFAINMSQPHLNNMETIYQNTIDKGIQIVGLSKTWLSENDIRNGDYKHSISV